jgi:hypothetical protein
MHPGSMLTDAIRQWPSPTAAEARRGAFIDPDKRTQGGKRGGQLTDVAVSQWPTPAARDWKDSPGMATTGTNPDGSIRQRDDQLARAAQQWPTPTAAPYGSSQNGSNGIGGAQERPSANTQSLERMSRSFLPLLPMSTAGDACSPSDPTSRLRSRAKLNAAFVEWLMGWPIGWTASALAATEWCRWSRRMRFASWRLAQASGISDD